MNGIKKASTIQLNESTPMNEDKKYLDEIVIPYFSGFIHQNIDTGLFTPDGVIIASSIKGANNYGVDHEELVGMSYYTMDLDFIAKICESSEIEDLIGIASLFKKIGELNKIIAKEKKAVNYIDVIPYKSHYSATIVTHIPIINPITNNVIATQAIGNNFYLYGIVDYINSIHKEQNLVPLKPFVANINLSPRQHEVLFLLTVGLSQLEIAKVLGITRGTVSSIITHQLSNKLGLLSTDTLKLVEMACNMGLDKYIPPSLYKPRIIILDDEIEQKYFAQDQ